jgi:hypothetical protein
MSSLHVPKYATTADHFAFLHTNQLQPEELHLHTADVALYVGNSISKLQIQVAT